MSPMRIGSIGLSVLMIRPMLNLSPTLVSSMVPLGFSVGCPAKRRRRSTSSSAGRAPMRRLMLTRTSRGS